MILVPGASWDIGLMVSGGIIPYEVIFNVSIDRFRKKPLQCFPYRINSETKSDFGRFQIYNSFF